MMHALSPMRQAPKCKIDPKERFDFNKDPALIFRFR
jgi:hypothetical protein